MMTGEVSAVAKIRVFLVKPLEWFLIASMAVLLIDVLWGVFSRYALGAQSSWTEELAIYLLIWISLLGGALVFGEKGHLGVDYFVKKMDPAAQRLAAICVEVVALGFSAYALVGGGWKLVMETLAVEQTSPAMGWPMGYVYLAVPVSGLFFCIFAIEHLIEIFAGRSFLEQDSEPVKDI